MSILTLIVPAIAVLLIAAPLVSVAQGKVTGKSAIRNRFALHFGAFALACICAVAVPASKLPALLPPSRAPMPRVWASWLPLW
mgnify:CR=1 FL=1